MGEISNFVEYARENFDNKEQNKKDIMKIFFDKAKKTNCSNIYIHIALFDKFIDGYSMKLRFVSLISFKSKDIGYKINHTALINYPTNADYNDIICENLNECLNLKFLDDMTILDLMRHKDSIINFEIDYTDGDRFYYIKDYY